MTFLDSFAKRLFSMTARQAWLRGICIRCKEAVSPSEWELDDQAEYWISALCPDCFLAIMGPEDDDEHP